MGRKTGTIIILILVIVFGYIGYDYFSFRAKNAVSEASFIKSDKLANLTFKVKGKVVEMRKQENDPVKKGELLAVIDPTDLNVTKRRVEYEIESLVKKIEEMRLKKSRLKKTLRLKTSIAKNDIESIKMRMESLKFKIKAAQTKLEKVQKDAIRFKQMLEKRLISSSDYENVQTQRDSLADEREGMKRELRALETARKSAEEGYKVADVTQKMIMELEKGIASAQERLKAQKEALKDVENKLAYTRLYAPFDGVIAKKYFDAPRVIESGTPVYALTDPKKLYCEVLLSEKKMHGVEPGNRATITVEALKNREFEGRVESIAPTSASTFSLVPRDIASGEFTKLDQRFVVRLSIKDDVDGLRAGMSATVAIERK